jgi:major membrane immunogen (membrane-anchored lipoprotein)
MRIFFGVMLIAGALLLFSCSSSDSSPAPKPTPQTLTWDAEKPTWDNAKWN